MIVTLGTEYTYHGVQENLTLKLVL